MPEWTGSSTPSLHLKGAVRSPQDPGLLNARVDRLIQGIDVVLGHAPLLEGRGIMHSGVGLKSVKRRSPLRAST